jgi:hypothetical protein
MVRLINWYILVRQRGCFWVASFCVKGKVTTLDDLPDALAKAATGGSSATAVKDQKRAAMETQLKQLA